MTKLCNSMIYALLVGVAILNCGIRGSDYRCADLTGDEVIDINDFAFMADEWQDSGAGVASDLDRDGVVEVTDLGVLGSSWLDAMVCPSGVSHIRMVGSLAGLGKLIPANNDIVMIAGYREAGDGGWGLFRYDAESSLADDGCTVIRATYGDGCWVRMTGELVNVKAFGAVGDGIADDTGAIQAAINAMCALGGGTVYLPTGRYRVSQTIDLNGPTRSVAAIRLVGDGASATTITIVDAFADDDVMIAYQGSGTAEVVIQGIELLGSGIDVEQTAILLSGVQGAKVRQCRFNGFRYGVCYCNEAGQVGAHYNVVQDCEFASNKTVVRYYRVGSGSAAAFVGSGIVNSLTHAEADIAVIAVEDVSGEAEPARLVNVPLHFGSFIAGDSKVVLRSNVSSTHTAYGHIWTEGELGWLAKGSGHWQFDGTVTALGEVRLGPIKYRGLLAKYGPASGGFNGYTMSWRNYDKYEQTLQSGTTTLTYGVGNEGSVLYEVSILGPSYDYRYLLCVTHQGFGGNGMVDIVDTARTYNGSGAGSPSFSVDSSGRLQITNCSYNANYTISAFKTSLASTAYPTSN